MDSGERILTFWGYLFKVHIQPITTLSEELSIPNYWEGWRELNFGGLLSCREHCHSKSNACLGCCTFNY